MTPFTDELLLCARAGPGQGHKQVLVSTQLTRTDSDTCTLRPPTLCILHCLLDQIAPPDVKAIRWLAQDSRGELSEKYRSILLSLAACVVIFQGIEDSDEIALLGASQY